MDRASWSALPSALFLLPLRSLAAGQQLCSPTPLSAFLCGGWGEHHLRGLPAPCTLAGSPPTRTFFQLWPQPEACHWEPRFPSAQGQSPPTEPRAIPNSAAVSEAPKGPAQQYSQPPGPPSQQPCRAYPSPHSMFIAALCCSPGTSPYTGQEAAEPASPSQRSQPLPKPHG